MAQTTPSHLSDLSDVVSESATVVHSWADFEEFYSSLGDTKGRWCFRGHKCADWRLETLLERVTKGNKDRIDAEQYFIKAFRRRAHHFIDAVPESNDLLEWLALMQHWGVPTRLLDFTTSPYIALFFALNSNAGNSDDSDERLAAVWAIHHVACKGIAVHGLNELHIHGLPKLSHSSLLGEPELFQQCFFGDQNLCFVAPVQPFRLNERLAVQQGLFLCPSNVRFGFEANLVQPSSFQEYVQAQMANSPTDAKARVKDNLKTLVRKAVISASGARNILPRLYSMNLNSGSLFPDLNGYAKSIVERYRALQLLDEFEKRAVGFNALSEFDSLG